MHDIYTRLFPEAFPKDEIRSWRSIRRQLQAGKYEGWGLYEDGELYSYAFFFHRGNIFFFGLSGHPARRARQGVWAAHFCACCSGSWHPPC